MTGKRLVVHGGMHKTGSTAVQSHLFNHFSAPGHDYLHNGKANASAWMLRAFKDDLASLPGFRRKGLDSRAVARIRRHARDGLARAIAQRRQAAHILCAESISTLERGEIERFRQFLEPFYTQIDIHFYVRPLKPRVESAFQEKLKKRLVSLQERYSHGYPRLAQEFDAVFGCKSVHFHRYDTSAFPGGDVVAHFLQQLGLSYEGLGMVRENVSLSLPAIQLLYVYRTQFPTLQPADDSLVRKLGELSGPALRFHSKLFAGMIECSAETEQRVREFERRAGFSMSERSSVNEPYALKSEQDLLAVPQEALQWLAGELGDTHVLFERSQGRQLRIAEAVRDLAIKAKKGSSKISGPLNG